uniref:G-protein coupled receptors family 1 profile domain-containing protein n=1 Tax=Romanomermis culicivorax TaxID=13658 RepID=A0A915J896_ROMCU
MNNSSASEDDTFVEENIICSYSTTFCITLGVVFECCSIVGLSLNLLLIFIFVKFGYCKKEPVLALTFCLFLCDCFHLLILAVHLSPEMIDASDETTWDWWDETMNFVAFYVWIVNLFILTIICRVRYEATCDYAKFRQIYTKK